MKTGRRISLTVLAVALGFAASGCQSLTEPIPEPYDLEAVVESITESRTYVTVEWSQFDNQEIPHRASLADPRAYWAYDGAIFRETEDGMVEAEWEDLEVGDRLGLHVDGEARIDPPVYHWRQIVILID